MYKVNITHPNKRKPTENTNLPKLHFFFFPTSGLQISGSSSYLALVKSNSEKGFPDFHWTYFFF